MRLIRLSLLAVLSAALMIAGLVPAQAAAGPYTALGDSYSSGVGTRPVPSNNVGCHWLVSPPRNP